MFDSERFVRVACTWIQDRVQQANAKGVVLGLSGGLDSAVTAYLCVKALGADKVRVVWLPCQSMESELADAQLVARSLHLQLSTVDISRAYQDLRVLLGHLSPLTSGNIKSRLRMVTLYALANEMNLMVAGTGDKSEEEVGFFTKYGDGGVDILPIGDIYKTEVRELARYLGVPVRVIEKPSSPGLVENQTAEGDLGMTYEKIDAILSGGMHMGAMDEVEKIRQMQTRSRHKREMPPVLQFPRHPA